MAFNRSESSSDSSMKHSSRRLSASLLSALALLMAASIYASPALATPSRPTSNLATTTTCAPPTGCSLPSTTAINDTISVCASSDGTCHAGSSALSYSASLTECEDELTSVRIAVAGALCEDVYQGTCASIGSLVLGLPDGVAYPSDSSSGTSTTYTLTVTTSTLTGAGNYVWIVTFAANTGLYPNLPSQQVCEPFVLTSPTSVPQFPLGLLALIAMAIPALLLVRATKMPKISV
jgi:hypothetical protein